MLDFRLAVIGVTGVHGLGVSAACELCARENPVTAQQCQGFGAGCLGAREAARRDPPADNDANKR